MAVAVSVVGGTIDDLWSEMGISPDTRAAMVAMARESNEYRRKLRKARVFRKQMTAERDRYRAALEAITKVEYGNSWAPEENAWKWIDAVNEIVRITLAPPKE